MKNKPCNVAIVLIKLTSVTFLILLIVITGVLSRLYSSEAEVPQFETLAVSVPKKNVFHVEMNRPKQLNAFNKNMWLYVFLPTAVYYHHNIKKKIKNLNSTLFWDIKNR